ncbi:MAG: GntR family transcriptional regulator [Chloroflexi bacterium]|nr:MAG: GntR family transcriptional regulator [Chloroflexota bacterium]
MALRRPKPITQQISDLLIERIHSGIYAPGTRLPSESELAEELGVSRSSIRTALARLAAEGMVIRKQGDGTYVNEHLVKVPTRFGGMWDFMRLIANSGHTPRIELLEQHLRPATAGESQALHLEAGAEVVALRRRFFADERPVILTTSAMPASLLREPLRPRDGEMTINELMWRRCRQSIAYTIIDIHAVLPDENTLTGLQREHQAPLLRLEQLFYNKDNRPVYYSISCYDDKALGLRLAQAWG